ncbi:hypothetical protein rosag_42620 [Roseisolibacter agri]|uniref:Uncharacterized protein n=1 Tax=Roseisolibacter agri TaxID=2014610 RepID=A0AA37VG18_9BACT|nr:hypothetical protein rosag_42620 [Roseisolibacter agri]
MTPPPPAYQSNPVHQNGRPGSSQWWLNVAEENDCFVIAFTQGWVSTHEGWGLWIVDGRAVHLGVIQDHVTPTFFAKFECKRPMMPWHGYPEDQCRTDDRQCVPDEAILSDWERKGYIRPQVAKKVGLHKRCRL